MAKFCLKCGKKYSKPYTCSNNAWKQRKYCSKSCANSETAMINGKQFEKGTIPWNKGKKLPQYTGSKHPNYSSIKLTCKTCGEEFIVRNYRKEQAKYCSRKCHYNDNLGLSSENEKERRSKRYRDWRTKIFERDNYTCQTCGIKNEKGLGKTIILQADHIKSFAFYPDDRYKLDNGRTLCVKCHHKTATFGIQGYRKHVLAVGEEA